MISGSISELPIKIYRDKNGVTQPGILVGSVPIGASAAQQIIKFTVDPITDSGYVNSDPLVLSIELPLDVDFEVGLTGTWLQESVDGTVQISESSSQLGAARQFFGGSGNSMQSEESSDFYGYPVVIGNGRSGLMPLTGSMFMSGYGDTGAYPYAVNMKSDQEILANSVFQNAPTNRIINFIHSLGSAGLAWRKSVHSFTTEGSSATTLVVGTGLATDVNSEWESFGTTVAITKTSTAFAMGVEASYIYEENTYEPVGFKMTWRDNGVVTTGIYNPSSFFGLNLTPFEGGETPIVANYLCYFYQSTASVGMNHTVLTSSQNGTATTKAEYSIYMKLADAASPSPTDFQSPYEIRSIESRSIEYGRSYLQSKGYRLIGGQEDLYPINYLAWQDPATPLQPTTGYDINGVYKNILAFNVNGSGIADVPTTIAGGVTRTVVVNNYDSIYTITSNIVEAINNPVQYTFTFSGIPAGNGVDKQYISNKGTDFVILFQNTSTTPVKPQNPDTGRVPIYVQYTSASTLPDVISSLDTAILTAVIGIPSPAQVGAPTEPTRDTYLYL